MELNPQEKAKQISICESIAGLEQTEGWKHFVIAANSLAEANFPAGDYVGGQDAAIATASKVCFITGIKRCLGIMQQAKEQLKTLTDPELSDAGAFLDEG